MILGVSAGFHDAALSLIDRDGSIVFAGHSERYSKVKNDSNIDPSLLDEVRGYPITDIAYYERPWMHKLRTWYTGENDSSPWLVRSTLKKYLGDFVQNQRLHCFPHHLSHAAAGFQTSPFDQAAVVVIDAIGEFDTISIYHAWYNDQGRACYKKLWGRKYPHSIGLFYSALTKTIGFKPNEEEYITMGYAAYCSPLEARYNLPPFLRQYVRSIEHVQFKDNLHLGDTNSVEWLDKSKLAGVTQLLAERLIMSVISRARDLVDSENLVYSGGVALNCVANRLLGRSFGNVWIMPNPGDAGSSLGAGALVLGSRIQFKDAYLGHDIPGSYPVNDILDHLLSSAIVGVASGRAEFGPRALGNRSLLADPRKPDIRDRVNEIKRRQQFRPFAPVILEEHVDDYFYMPEAWPTSSFMQVTATVKNPDLYPGIVHVDGSARVQTVPRSSNSGIRKLLEKWYVLTGCPMLLNTSLNIRGEPMVNDRADADRFEQLYNVKVFS